MSYMSSRRTISDDTRCINILHGIVDVIWLSIILLHWPVITTDAADTSSTNHLTFLGLPRKNHCAINYNNMLFILLGESIGISSPMSLSITFANNITNVSSTQMPSIQWIPKGDENNTHQSQTPSSASICAVTSYGQAIIFHPSLQINDTIDLNSLNWTLTTSSRQTTQSRSSSTLPSDLITVAATMMNDDRLLILGRNSTALSTWILDASDGQLEWDWAQLSAASTTNNAMHEPRLMMMLDGVTDGFVSASLTTTSSYALYFGVYQQSPTEMFYSVSVHCFDTSSLSWIGSLLNFTSPTNHIQPVMISKQNTNSSNTNDTLLIVPDWIDAAIITTPTSDRNVTNVVAAHKQQTERQYRYSKRQQQQEVNNGYWILTLETPTDSSALPSAHLLWHALNSPSDGFISTNGGSATLLDDTVVFYGGERDIRGRESLTSMGRIHNSIDHAANDSNSGIRFWNTNSKTFLPAPAWLTPYLPSPEPTPSSPEPTSSPSSSPHNEFGYRTVIIILASFLGLFGTGFIILVGLLLWRRQKQHTASSIDIAQDHDQPLEASLPRRSPSLPNTTTTDQNNSAAIWAAHLHRSFSIMLHRLRTSISSTQSQQRAPNATPSGLVISAPLAPSNHDGAETEKQQAVIDTNENSSGSPHRQQENPIHHPSLLQSPSSNGSHIDPSSTRNSWREEGSVKASRFVEHF